MFNGLLLQFLKAWSLFSILFCSCYYFIVLCNSNFTSFVSLYLNHQSLFIFSVKKFRIRFLKRTKIPIIKFKHNTWNGRAIFLSTFKQKQQFHWLSTNAKAPVCIVQENSSYLTKLKPTASAQVLQPENSLSNLRKVQMVVSQHPISPTLDWNDEGVQERKFSRTPFLFQFRMQTL